MNRKKKCWNSLCWVLPFINKLLMTFLKRSHFTKKGFSFNLTDWFGSVQFKRSVFVTCWFSFNIPYTVKRRTTAFIHFINVASCLFPYFTFFFKFNLFKLLHTGSYWNCSLTITTMAKKYKFKRFIITTEK